jgi:hypothetical protein
MICPLQSHPQNPYPTGEGTTLKRTLYLLQKRTFSLASQYGTILLSTLIGSFTDCTVSLASYDLFPMLAVQPGQTTVENNPSQVEVCVDSHAIAQLSAPCGSQQFPLLWFGLQ